MQVSAACANGKIWYFGFQTQYVFLHQCIMDCLQQDEKTEDNYNLDLIYVNATVLQEFR